LTIPTHAVWTGALVLTTTAAWTDLRARRIPNWLTVPAFFAGIVVNSLLMKWHGFEVSLEGAGLALALLLPLVLMRALGAGDWKLMGAAGAILGPARFLVVLLASICIAGLMAVAEVLRQGRVKQTVMNVAVLVQGFFTFGLRPNPRISLDNPGMLKLPFGVAAAAATAACYGVVFWHLR
jgi:prepilin peptidase CpaA